MSLARTSNSPAFKRTRDCLIRSGALVLGVCVLTIALYALAGGRLIVSSEAVFDVYGCKAHGMAEFPAAGHLRRAPESSGPAWSGQVDFEHDSAWFRFGAAFDQIPEWVESLETRDCSVESWRLSQTRAWSWLGMATSAMVATLLLFVAFRRRLGNPPDASGRAGRQLLLASASGVILALVFGSAMVMLFPEAAVQHPFEGLDLSPALLFGMVAILVPVSEELLFRRMALQLWVKARLPWLGTILVSGWFAGLHLTMRPEAPWTALLLVSLFVLSVAASLAYRYSGWAGASVLHCAYNATLIAPLLLVS